MTTKKKKTSTKKAVKKSAPKRKPPVKKVETKEEDPLDDDEFGEFDDDDDDEDDDDIEEKSPKKAKKAKKVEEHEDASEEDAGDFVVKLPICLLSQIQEIENLKSEWAVIFSEEVGDDDFLYTAQSFEDKKDLALWLQEQQDDSDSELKVEHVLKKGRPRKFALKMKVTFS